MKVILLRDVAKIGKRYEVVNVPDGFAQNKLIPKGDAQAATPDNLKRVLNMRAKGASDKAAELSSIKAMVDSLAEAPLEVPMQANEQGHLKECACRGCGCSCTVARCASTKGDCLYVCTNQDYRCSCCNSKEPRSDIYVIN